MSASLRITGAREVEAKLKEMGKSASKKYCKLALREGAKPIQAQAVAYAPKKTHVLERSIKIRAGSSKKDVVSILVGPGKKWFTGKAFYAAFVESGHFLGKRLAGKFRGAAGKIRYRAQSVLAGRKWIPGVFFMEHAYNTKKSEAERITKAKIEELIMQDAK